MRSLVHHSRAARPACPGLPIADHKESSRDALPRVEGHREGHLNRVIAVLSLLLAALCAGLGHPSAAQAVNGGFESGGFDGWTADPTWVVVDNSCGYYSGWEGKYWAWSGGKGEPATGALTSKPFLLDKPAVRLLISGWSSIRGTGQPRRWNYVTLNLTNGTEIDRVYAPDTTAFVPVFLDGSKHRGKSVFIRAVDDADQPTFSPMPRASPSPGSAFTRPARHGQFLSARAILPTEASTSDWS